MHILKVKLLLRVLLNEFSKVSEEEHFQILSSIMNMLKKYNTKAIFHPTFTAPCKITILYKSPIFNLSRQQWVAFHCTYCMSVSEIVCVVRSRRTQMMWPHFTSQTLTQFGFWSLTVSIYKDHPVVKKWRLDVFL